MQVCINRRKQNGVVLLVGLLLLLVMTVLGVASLGNTSLQEKMAGNTRQKHLAIQAAETALRDAETWLDANINLVSDLGQIGTTNKFYASMSLAEVQIAAAPAGFSLDNESAWLSNANTEEIQTSIPGLAQSPRYYIEYVGRAGDNPLEINNTAPDLRPYMFRITAFGWGADTNARYLLRSHYRLDLS